MKKSVKTPEFVIQHENAAILKYRQELDANLLKYAQKEAAEALEISQREAADALRVSNAAHAWVLRRAQALSTQEIKDKDQVISWVIGGYSVENDNDVK